MTKTNIELQNPELTNLLSDISDDSGLAEIQNAFDEIAKIENQGANQNEAQQTENADSEPEPETDQQADKPDENVEQDIKKREKKLI